MEQPSRESIGESIEEWLADPLHVVSVVVGLLLSLLVLWYTFYGALVPRRRHANLVLGASVLIYYWVRAGELRRSEGVRDLRDTLNLGWYIIAGLAGFFAAGYVHLNYTRWIENSALLIYNDVDLLVGATIMVLVIDITFRSFGKALGSAVVASLVYGIVGPYLPSFWSHSGISIPNLIARQTIVLAGVYGSLLQITATWVAIFILFAGFVEAHQGFDFINRVGRRVATKSRSGIAQSAVVSSMFVGMLTGGSAVNVALTGSFTIPLMKEHNIPPRIAAAIESMASSGGQVLPPVMGLAAFLIADFIGVRYADVLVAAIIPALLFYGTVAIAVHVIIVSSGWTPEITAEDIIEDASQDGGSLAVESLQYLIPIVVLMYMLIGLRYPIMDSGGYTIGTFLLLRGLYIASPFSPDTLSVDRMVQFVLNTVEALWIGAKRLAPFVGLLAALGILTNTLAFTGIGLRMSTAILIAGGESFIVVLFLAMVVSIIFGMGMPTPAAYILVATVLAPTLVRLGLPDMISHLYVFYFALLSSITPPVAIAVAVASEIAESDFLQTTKSTLIIGGPVFFIPYVFVANQSLITWSTPNVFVYSALIAVAILSLIFALTGTNGNRSFAIVERGALFLLFFVSAFLPATFLGLPGMLLRAVAAVAVLGIALRGSGLLTRLQESTVVQRRS